jgi:hypothetical protein
VIDHPMNRETFDTWVETQLAPTLRKGDVVILDNLASHKSAKRLSSGSAAPGSSSCRPTAPISIQSKWPSPSLP